MIRYIRKIILTFTIISLITTNLLTLFHKPFTTALSKALSTAFGVSSVTSALETALDARTLESQRQIKAIANKDNLLKTHQQKAQRRKAAIRHYGHSATLRTKRLIKKTLAAIPAESVPILGTAVIVGGSAYEIYTACQNLKDIEVLYSEFQVEGSPENSFMSKVCNRVL